MLIGVATNATDFIPGMVAAECRQGPGAPGITDFPRRIEPLVPVPCEKFAP